MMSVLDAALAYAAYGFSVFPCLPRAKEPAVKRGFYAATTNPETIRRLFRSGDCNVAIRTGMASHVWAIDSDGEVGEASLCALEAKHGTLPATWQSLTARGRHIWFCCDDPVPSSAARIAPGIDARGDGGYILAPPSIHPTGARYSWSTHCAGELAVAPAWLLGLARKKPPTISQRAIALMPPRRINGSGGYGQAALNAEVAALAGAVPGQRNHALNRAGFLLFQLVAGGEIEREQVITGLLDACHRNGLIKDDGLHAVMATIRSAYLAGIKHPRSRPGAA
jgi:hypothetical protein